MSAQPFPWQAAMQFGFGVMHLSSDAFWKLTPRELAAAVRARQGGTTAAPDRQELDLLMERFPDITKEHCHDGNH